MTKYQNKNGIISFKQIIRNKYTNKSLIQIINKLVKNNSIKECENNFEEKNNVCISTEIINNEIINNKINNIDKYPYVGIGGENYELENSSYVGYIEINEKNMYDITLDNGLYTYIITYNKTSFKIHMSKILPFEMFTKHNNLLKKIYEKYKSFKILSAGECKIHDKNMDFNFKSGHVMKPIRLSSYFSITKDLYDKKNNDNSDIKYWWSPLISHIFEKLLPNYTNKYTPVTLIIKKDHNIVLLNKLITEFYLKDNMRSYKTKKNCLKDINGKKLI
jgi:hypothetical protein